MMKSDAQHLKNISFFEGFSESELEQLLDLNRIDRYNQGEAIIKENDGDKSNGAYYFVILRGSVDVIKQGKKLATLEKGDCFGELAYLVNQKRTADVIAVSDETLVMEINGEKVDKVTTSNLRNKLTRKLAVTLANKLINASQLIANDLDYVNNTEEDSPNENNSSDLNLFQFLSRTKLLKAVSFFAPFSSNQLAEILTLPHSFISAKGDQAVVCDKKFSNKFYTFYVLLKGTVKVVKEGKTVSALGQGDCFTQSGNMHSGKSQKADLIAVNGSKIFAINLGVFEKAGKEMQLLFYKQFGKHQARRLAS